MLTYPELRNLIAVSRSDNTCEIFDAAVTVFDKYNVPGYMNVFDATIGSHPDAKEEELIGYLIEDACLMCQNLLGLQGIRIHDDVSLSNAVALTDATFDMPNYEDEEHIDSLLNLPETPIEIYGQLVMLVSHLSVEDVLGMVADVTPSFIPTFKELLKNQQDPEETDELMPRILAAYVQWKTNCNGDLLLYADRYLQQNTSIGLPFEVYLHLYQTDGRVMADANLEQLQQIAKDIFGLALLSSDGFNNPLLTIRSKLSMLFPDVDSSTKVDLEINKILMEYIRK